MTWKHGLLAFLAIATLAQARLGDTEAELIQRFGEPKLRSKHHVLTQGKSWVLGPALFFKQSDWSIQCDLVEGRCMRISYSKPGDWSEEQVQLVLSSNSQGVRWNEGPEPSIAKLKRTWKRNDGSTAVWTRSGMSLTWIAYEKAKAAVEERAKGEAKKMPRI